MPTLAMADPAARPVPEDLRPLTALRFVAALWVVGYDYWSRLFAGRPLALERGRLGVEVFFVLSGFILSHVYLAQVIDGRFRYREFLWARLARIYPVHLATLAGLGLVVLAARAAGASVGEHVVRLASLPAQLTLTQAWGFTPVAGWNHPSWSISAEWFAYLGFPAVAAAALAMHRRPWMALVLALGAGGALYVLFPAWAGFQLSQATTRWGWLRIAPPFALGCALNLLWRSWRRDPAASAAAPLWAVAGTVAAMTAAVALRLPDAVVVACAGALILALAALPARVAAGRATDVAVYLGEVSFALYMMVTPWQVVYENGVQRLFHLPEDALLPPAAWAGLVAGLLPAAMLLHHLVERPARTWMRARGLPFSRRGRAAPEPDGVEPAFHPARAPGGA